MHAETAYDFSGAGGGAGSRTGRAAHRRDRGSRSTNKKVDA